MLVWPLPSAPWQRAQDARQFSFGSAAETARAAAKPMPAIRIIFFMVVFLCVCFRRCLWRLFPILGSLKKRGSTTHVLAKARHFLRRRRECPIEMPGQNRRKACQGCKSLVRGWRMMVVHASPSGEFLRTHTAGYD